jgi:hypothetical protein
MRRSRTSSRRHPTVHLSKRNRRFLRRTRRVDECTESLALVNGHDCPPLRRWTTFLLAGRFRITRAGGLRDRNFMHGNDLRCHLVGCGDHRRHHLRGPQPAQDGLRLGQGRAGGADVIHKQDGPTGHACRRTTARLDPAMGTQPRLPTSGGLPCIAPHAKRAGHGRRQPSGHARGDRRRVIHAPTQPTHEWGRHRHHQPSTARRMESPMHLVPQLPAQFMQHGMPGLFLPSPNQRVQGRLVPPESHEGVEARPRAATRAHRPLTHRPSNRLRAIHPHADPASEAVMRIARPGHGLAHCGPRRRTTSSEQPSLEPGDGQAGLDAVIHAHGPHAAMMGLHTDAPARRGPFSGGNAVAALRRRPSSEARSAGCRRAADSPPRPACPRGRAP